MSAKTESALLPVTFAMAFHGPKNGKSRYAVMIRRSVSGPYVVCSHSTRAEPAT